MDTITNGIALAAPIISCIAFLCTLFTAYLSRQYCKAVEDAENQTMSLLDEALQIMIPMGICKRICQPNMNILLDNNDSKVVIQKPSAAPQHFEYPEDVSVALADEEVIYDHFGFKKEESNLESTCQRIIELAIGGIKGREALVKEMKSTSLKSAVPNMEAEKTPSTYSKAAPTPILVTAREQTSIRTAGTPKEPSIMAKDLAMHFQEKTCQDIEQARVNNKA
ncbi:hypothetical protein RB195_012775 [Necator americanus]|uniref:Uncharacterized protein n=1 Tax=Necator americanus TaxID=51031 RepID=A0ABR1DTZ7_NECAM